MRLSKKKLLAWLSKRFNQTVTLKNVADETYSYKKDSRIYLFGVNKRFGISRKCLERELKQAGFKVFPTYWPGSDHVEIGVSYFKGWHWDE